MHAPGHAGFHILTAIEPITLTFALPRTHFRYIVANEVCATRDVWMLLLTSTARLLFHHKTHAILLSLQHSEKRDQHRNNCPWPSQKMRPKIRLTSDFMTATHSSSDLGSDVTSSVSLFCCVKKHLSVCTSTETFPVDDSSESESSELSPPMMNEGAVNSTLLSFFCPSANYTTN